MDKNTVLKSPLMILFVNLKGNVGDFAILHAMLLDLERRYPGREKHVFSLGNRAVDNLRMARFLEQPHPRFVYKHKTPFHEIRSKFKHLEKIGLKSWLAGKLIARLSRKFHDQEPISAAADYEAIFLAGGEQWSGFAPGINMFAILDAISQRNRNIFMFPFSVKKKLLESYPTSRLKRSFSQIRSDLVVRDRSSGATMQRIAPGVIKGADCVFGLAKVAAALPSPHPSDGTTIVIAVTETGGPRLDNLRDILGPLTAAGFRLRLLTTCEIEDGRHLKHLADTPGVDFVAPATWQDTVVEMKTAALVVTNRFHCIIFSFFADVPVVPLLNREKVTGIYADSELTHSLKNMAELTPSKIWECIDARAQILGKMRTYLAKTRSLRTTPWSAEDADFPK